LKIGALSSSGALFSLLSLPSFCASFEIKERAKPLAGAVVKGVPCGINATLKNKTEDLFS
jgi:hypothetical protein